MVGHVFQGPSKLGTKDLLLARVTILFLYAIPMEFHHVSSVNKKLLTEIMKYKKTLRLPALLGVVMNGGSIHRDWRVIMNDPCLILDWEHS